MIIASTVLGRLDVLWLKRPADRVKTRFVEVRCWGRGTEIVIGGTERIISWLPRRSEREQHGASRAERGPPVGRWRNGGPPRGNSGGPFACLGV